MQSQKSEEQEIIIFITFDQIIQHQTEKQNNTADQCLNNGFIDLN